MLWIARKILIFSCTGPNLYLCYAGLLFINIKTLNFTNYTRHFDEILINTYFYEGPKEDKVLKCTFFFFINSKLYFSDYTHNMVSLQYVGRRLGIDLVSFHQCTMATLLWSMCGQGRVKTALCINPHTPFPLHVIPVTRQDWLQYLCISNRELLQQLCISQWPEQLDTDIYFD